MKANEAPDKIYVHIKDKPCEITFSEVIEKECLNIEYVRTDTFIEKAKKWFEKQNEWFDPNGNRHCDLNSFEDFRKYMEE